MSSLFRSNSVFLLFPVLALLSGCALPMEASVDAPIDVRNDLPYLLSPGDTVRITVFGEEKLSGDYLIDQRGVISLPMLGEIPAAGWTKGHLQERLSAEFENRGFLRQPLLTVDAAAVRPLSIIGEVKNPGNYAYRPLYTVFQVIAISGGYTPRAAENKILIDRWVEGNLVRMNATQNTPVLSGDAITVRERIF